MQQPKSSLTICRSLLLATLIAAVTGQDVMAQGITAPEPIKQDGRFIPGFAGDSITRVRFTVKADGTTADVVVIPEMPLPGNQMQTNGTSQTVKKWTFKPATLNGNPIEIRNQEILLVARQDPNMKPPQAGGEAGRIRAPGSAPASRPGQGQAPAAFDPANMPTIPLYMSESVSKALNEALEQKKNKEYDKAFAALAALKAKGLHRVSDYASIHLMESTLYADKNQQFEALDAVGHSTMYWINGKGEKSFMLEPVYLEQALRQKVILAFVLRHHAEAQDAFALLKEQFIITPEDKINEIIKNNSAMLAAPEPLTLLAKLPEKGQWTYPLTRRSFTAADVKGKLDTITARCERKDYELKYEPDKDVTLPASWGKCVLDFAGKEGTTFTLYESHPPQQ